MVLPKPVVIYCAGCFNPITNKHLRIMELARDALHRTGRYNVLKGVFAPAHDKYGKQGLLSAAHRHEMASLAVKSNPWLSVDSWEIQESDWTPTSIALTEFKKRLQAGTYLDYSSDDVGEPSAKKPRQSERASAVGKSSSNSLVDAQVMMLCGTDTLESFSVPNLWDEEHMEQIVRDFGVIVIERGHEHTNKYIYESSLLTKYSSNIHVIKDWTADELSSTKVRRAVERNDSIKYLVPDSVLDYIIKHKLYNPHYTPGYPYPSTPPASS